MMQEELEDIIKGKYNLLTKQEDFESQVIVAQEFICNGQSDDIDLQGISRTLTFQIKKSQDIRPGRYYGNYYNFARFNRFLKRRKTKRSRKKKDKKSNMLGD